MYLERIRIQRMKRIRDLTLTIPKIDGHPRSWTVIIGENGTAKTSILQAIAMAAAGGSQVNAVMDRGVDLLRDRRAGDEPLAIEADFVFTPESRNRRDFHPLVAEGSPVPRSLHSTIKLEPASTTVIGFARYSGAAVDQDPLNHARARHLPLWFVAGYGVARVLPDSSVTPDLAKRSIERLKPLFDHRAPLASVGFANYFMQRDVALNERIGTRARRFSKVLNQILKIGGNDLMPGVRGLELRGQGGAKSAGDLINADRFKFEMGKAPTMMIAGVALSHGFQSTFAWIADLVGHILLEADSELSPQEMEGLVLIDEIDLYLHPNWQATFIRALRRVFPKMQFIVTTHSPVVLASLDPSEIVRLGIDPDTGDVRQLARDPTSGELVPTAELTGSPSEADPRAMTGTEIYEDYFGISRLTLHPLGEEYRKYLALSGDPLRSSEQDNEVEKLKRYLDAAGLDIRMPVKRETDA